MLITSANAVRNGGPGLSAFAHLPCYAVGEASAAAARAAGFEALWIGGGDAMAAAAAMAERGVRRAFHPCGRDHVAADAEGVRIERRVVYASEPVPGLPERAANALTRGAVALLHSPRAASQFASLVERAGLERGAIAAISPNAAAEAGPGWRSVGVAAVPDDAALLEVAAKLCQAMEKEAQDREGRWSNTSRP
jgi:uroporphyrinogen-III synthase